jgi:hypothetical protein
MGRTKRGVGEEDGCGIKAHAHTHHMLLSLWVCFGPVRLSTGTFWEYNIDIPGNRLPLTNRLEHSFWWL